MADSDPGALNDRFIQAGCRKLIVDCTRLTYISSYGMGVLVRLHQKLAKRGGDVKLAAALGALLGYPLVLPGLVLGVIAGGLAALLLLLTRRAGRKDAMASPD